MLEDAKNGLVFESEREASINATLGLLYEKTTDAQGQAAREADTYAGVTASLTAKFEDMSAEIGTALLPILTDFSEWLQTPEGEAKLQAIVDGIVDIITEFAKAVDWVIENKDWLVPMVTAIGGVTAAWNIATAAVNTFKTAAGIATAVGAIGVASTTVLGTAAAGAAVGGFMEGKQTATNAQLYAGGYGELQKALGYRVSPEFAPRPTQNVTINVNQGNITADEIVRRLERLNKSTGGIVGKTFR
jgi:hypothetical protein